MYVLSAPTNNAVNNPPKKEPATTPGSALQWEDEEDKESWQGSHTPAEIQRRLIGNSAKPRNKRVIRKIVVKSHNYHHSRQSTHTRQRRNVDTAGNNTGGTHSPHTQSYVQHTILVVDVIVGWRWGWCHRVWCRGCQTG